MIDETEVSREAYENCVRNNGCSETRANDYSTTGQQPINGVSFYQARSYCEAQGSRLPSEHEWEYAARGPDGLLFPWGNGFVGQNANFSDVNRDWPNSNKTINDGYANISPIGSYPAGISWVGALDMGGNVWEWTNTLYKDYPYNKTDGRTIDSSNYKILNKISLRGGSFSDSFGSLRSAKRFPGKADNVSFVIGFRCARSNSRL